MVQNKKQFIEGLGATCKNWSWSWSFVSHENREIIFGTATVHEVGEEQLILSRSWERDAKGHAKNGYPQSIEHLRLVSEDGYQLRTFRQVEAQANDETLSVRIVSFEAELEDRLLLEKQDGWYAVPRHHFDDTSKTTAPQKTYFLEGSKSLVSSWSIERNPKARQQCIEHHEPICEICKFDFGEIYGEAGEGFIHVHHLNPLSESEGPRVVDPIEDLIPVCPNCHAIIHRGKKMRGIDEMKALLKNAQSRRSTK